MAKAKIFAKTGLVVGRESPACSEHLSGDDLLDDACTKIKSFADRFTSTNVEKKDLLFVVRTTGKLQLFEFRWL